MYTVLINKTREQHRRKSTSKTSQAPNESNGCFSLLTRSAAGKTRNQSWSDAKILYRIDRLHIIYIITCYIYIYIYIHVLHLSMPPGLPLYLPSSSSSSICWSKVDSCIGGRMAVDGWSTRYFPPIPPCGAAGRSHKYIWCLECLFASKRTSQIQHLLFFGLTAF